jgi:hypothetical protein
VKRCDSKENEDNEEFGGKKRKKKIRIGAKKH